MTVAFSSCVHVASPDDPQDVPDYGEHEIERQQNSHNEQHNYDNEMGTLEPDEGIPEDELDKTNGQREHDTFARFGDTDENVELATKEKTQKCDIKRCSLMFRQATMSHDLSYDMDNTKIDSMCV